jgi:ATP-binding cassette, subfamily B, multidrug efflux pump
LPGFDPARILSRVSIRILVPYLARYRARYLSGFALLLATNLAALAIPWVVKRTIEAVGPAVGRPVAPLVGTTPGRALTAGALLIVGLAILQGATRLASRYALLGASQRVEADIRDDLFDRLLRLPPAYYQTQRTGDLMSRATNDLQSVSQLIGFGSLSLANTVIVVLGTLAAMLRIDAWLTLAALGSTPVLVVLARRYSGRVQADSHAVQEQLSHLSARVQENLTGMAVVRAYAMEPREVAAFGRLNDEQLVRTLRLARTQATFSPLLGLIGGLGTLAVVWLGGKAVVDGRITLGDLVAFSSYLAALAWPILALGWILAVVRRGLAALARVIEVLRAGPTIADSAPGTGAAAIDGDVEFRGLTFAYEARRAPALQDVSLRIRAGECVAVVGPTGAGKTTLGALLARLWEPPAGTVFVDGREIHAIPLGELRAAIGYVPQEGFLFSGPLDENVALGESTDGRVAWAGRVAGLAEDVAALPGGWRTVVGERGLTLSGGQRQRATLARALVRDPRILVLDDTFASVDAEKEAEILASLRGVLRGRTTLLVTHRLRAARLADRIVVLDGGRIVEQCGHAELLARGGLYARLWQRQRLEAALEESPA